MAKQIDARDFNHALEELQKGHIPGNLDQVTSYTTGTYRELFEFTTALSECVRRMEQSNKLLRDMAKSLQESNTRLRAALAAAEAMIPKEEEQEE